MTEPTDRIVMGGQVFIPEESKNWKGLVKDGPRMYNSGMHFNSYLSMIHDLYERAGKLGKVLKDRYGIDVDIDEVALMFPDNESAQSFIQDCMVSNNGFVHFNAALDGVSTEPIRSGYSVRYDFLREGDVPIRLECMVIQTGVSPLHAALAQDVGWTDAPIPVHFSFKCTSEYDYKMACEALTDAGMTASQECASTYGQFSYWRINEESVYIKPRVNTRDADERLR